MVTNLQDGPYTLYSEARDAAGNIGTTIQYAFTVDRTSPVVTLIGSNPMSVAIGSTFSDPGATWADSRDGTGTILLVTSGSVNTNASGSYILTYKRTDAAGNIGSTTRTVIVNATPLNGVCGTASGQTFTQTPTTNLCSIGNAGTVLDGGIGIGYTWSCSGVNLGTPISCNANHVAVVASGGVNIISPSGIINTATPRFS
jgi:hypothetical protein